MTAPAPPAPATGTPPAPSPRQRAARPIGAALRPVIGWVVLLVVWQLLGQAWVDKHLIASPLGMVQAAVDNAAAYGRALGATARVALIGFVLGNAAAVLLAALVALLPAVERTVLRLALVAWCLPIVALGPLLRLVFGFNDWPQITLAAQAVYYTTLVPLLVGLRAVPAGWLDLVTSYGRGRVVALAVVRARASVPYLAAGLQVAVPAAFLGALVGEFTGAERGMGILTIQALRGLDTDGLWALAAISAAVSVAGYWLVGLITQRLAVGRPALLLAPPRVAAAARSRWLAWASRVGGVALTVVLVLGGWWAGLRLLDLNPYFAKGPVEVWEWLVTGPAAAEHRTEILDALVGTLVVAVPGYLAGLLLGAGLAALFELAPSIRRTATPIAVALRCVPIVAIAPLLVQALGRGPVGTTVVVALMTFFPTLVACAQGLRQAPAQVVDFFDSFDTPPWRTLLLARVPAMMPAFFSAARVAGPGALLGATVAEWLATGTGVGNLMAVAAGTSVYGTLWATVVVVTVTAVVVYGLVAAVERVVLARVAPEQSGW